MLAKIKFKDFDKDYYYIKGFENVIIKDALPDKYLQDLPYFYSDIWYGSPCIMIVTEHPLFTKRNYLATGNTGNTKKRHRFAIVQDTCIYKDDLPKLIAIMKRAGQRLTDIKQKKKEFTITI